MLKNHLIALGVLLGVIVLATAASVFLVWLSTALHPKYLGAVFALGCMYFFIYKIVSSIRSR